ncbi:FAD-binding oxidoreductase [Parashewanella spongiae]|uniref:D-2-hydroxyglutarate dehydrogenase n=1 Tax=Parashewanella spongiae TaxID=342950 RepID=A0A3A6TG49_9GAMM|nr:FAD-binding and (Fe-S)-binding domain-containing protein [Parashewanella spongiae]MCL1079910.1 FAD-binding oxidoreductase [Parashewanella spongiae]RJY06467.1 FAD-binding oxidoreductase [Parashewanella spongiae]
MLPRLSHQQTIEPIYLNYLTCLEASNFSGDVDKRYNARVVQSTDNSVYQFLPQAVIYPKTQNDVQLAIQIANKNEFKEIVFSPRGGGTGTNGQSLSHGIIIDLSRYMTKVIEVNPEEGWVKVETGIVKDALNDVLRPHGYFFSPDLSTSNRATVGGMINTDASGAGSLVYGKTSDHVLGLSSVLMNGELLDSAPLAADKILSNHSADLLSKIAEQSRLKRDLILEKFPDLNRFLTGYDLKHVWNDALDVFDISRILTGSEGTLAVITEAKLNITPIPKKRVMVNIKYDSFESALRHAPDLVKANATVVETIDSKVLNLAKNDIIWHSVKSLISDVQGQVIEGLNMVEFAGEPSEVSSKLHMLISSLELKIDNKMSGLIGFQFTEDLASINTIYAMRKKAVGLLGATKGQRKPLAFAEDTAVPPEKLADFIMEFRALLDGHQLDYGMFGHVDAGVLHVRPALNMCDPNDEKLLRVISDEVANLTMKYGGLMWGEHGKGVRGQYAPAIFGDELYKLQCQIKTWFDPHNRLNPGKLFAPDQAALIYNVDSKKRGSFDREIAITVRNEFPDIMNCNGNGLCFNYSPNTPMCPSYKVTGDRVQSPKGRTSVMREWLRLLSNQGVDIEALAKSKPDNLLKRFTHSFQLKKEYDFSHEVMESMQGCLACKSCSSQCPVKVDVPKFRSQFLDIYYKKYMRPITDHLVAGIEQGLPLLASAPRLINHLSHNELSKWLIKETLGYVDSPKLSFPTLNQRLSGHNCLNYDLAKLTKIPNEQRQNHVLIVQDPFNSYYDAQLVFKLVKLIEHLDLIPVLLPYKPNGKPAHVKGFLNRFAKTAKSSADFLSSVSRLGMPLMGIDPALVLCYRDEYKEVLGEKRGQFEVLLFNEWLAKRLNSELNVSQSNEKYTLFNHCTEATTRPNSTKEWIHIFEMFKLKLDVVNLGCCGMAGTYGHELKNLSNSENLFDMSWRPHIENKDQNQVLVTGFSCRSQVKRFAGFRSQHPIEILLEQISN